MSMPLVPHGKAHTAELIDGFEVVVPAQRNVVVIAFLGLWLLGWVQGESFALAALLSDATPLGARAFLAVWLALWTLGGAAALFAVLWLLVGSERLVLRAGELRLRREVFRLGRWKRIALEEVRRLRAFGTDIPSAARAGMRATGFGGGGACCSRRAGAPTGSASRSRPRSRARWSRRCASATRSRTGPARTPTSAPRAPPSLPPRTPRECR
jgi:hypothetical protein